MERLDDKIVRSAAQRFDLGLHIALDRHDDQRDGRHCSVFLHGADDTDSIGGWDDQIEQDEIGTVCLDPL